MHSNEPAQSPELADPSWSSNWGYELSRVVKNVISSSPKSALLIQSKQTKFKDLEVILNLPKKNALVQLQRDEEIDTIFQIKSENSKRIRCSRCSEFQLILLPLEL